MNVKDIGGNAISNDDQARLRAALVAKGNSSVPTYRALADEFNVHHETIRRFHLKIKANAVKEPETPVTGLPVDVLHELQSRIEKGLPPTGLFKPLPREEVEALMSGIIRTLAHSGKNLSILRQYLRDYVALQNMERSSITANEVVHEKLTDDELWRLENDAKNHLEAIKAARSAFKSKDFLSKYGTEVLEVEEVVVESVGDDVA